MLITSLKYFLALIVLSIVGVLALEFVVLPVYVGYNNEHYLPDLRGKYIENARVELASIGLNIEIIKKMYSLNHLPGTVVNMAPPPFTKVKEGRTIKLSVAQDRKNVEVPNFTRTSLRNALLEIERLGLVKDTIMEEYNSDFKKGTISYQSPRSGQLVKMGTKVTFMISKGNPPDFFRVPDLTNLSLSKAEIKIMEAGLKLGDVEFEYHPSFIPNTVIDQSLTVGMKLTIPARISLVVSTLNKEEIEEKETIP